MQSSQMIYWIENEGVKIIVNPYPENHKQLEKSSGLHLLMDNVRPKDGEVKKFENRRNVYIEATLTASDMSTCPPSL